MPLLLPFLLLPVPVVQGSALQDPTPRPVPRSVEVPLSLFTNPDWPNGLDFGSATGISFGDYDADGWIDIFAFASAHLWRNVDGTTWVLAADLDSVLPSAVQRYGSSFGDYNNDGLPDIGTEPRNSGVEDDCFHLLKNLGGGPNFADVAVDPAIVNPQPCGADSETIGWADVDGDGDLDMVLPTYPASMGSIDNQFLHNLGPTGPGGAYRFVEKAAAVGLLIPTGNARPEGCQFFDADADGDLDFYCNGGLYQNQSGFDAPLFASLPPDSSGIRKRTIVDEGTIFLDFDLDGDYDLLASYAGQQGLRLWESRGDGTWTDTPTDIIEDYRNGATFGLSAADWDLDGDVDFQALQTFRRNLAVEGGRGFVLATHNVDPVHLRGATASWGDWDKDGDVDVAIGNGAQDSFLYQNDSYDAATPAAEKRHLRVRALRDSTTVPAGLETEFGANVQVRVHGDDPGRHRMQYVSSSGGYLNQNEYTLTFALPADPAPADPGEDVRFDLCVDFPSLPEQGFRRVDKFVNPALGNLNLAALGDDREIVVFRSGKVVIRGCALVPSPGADSSLMTSTGGLVAPTPAAGLDDPSGSTSEREFVGIEIVAHQDLHLREIQVDGVLGDAARRGADAANLFLWDVTGPEPPALVPFGALSHATAPGNRRASLPADLPLQPGRRYRLVALVERWRPTPIQGPVGHGPFDVTGGLHFVDLDPWSGAGVSEAVVDPSRAFLAVRASVDPARQWLDLGASSPGAGTAPLLTATGASSPGAALTLSLSGAAPLADAALVVGGSVGCAEAAGVPVVPSPDFVGRGLRTDAAGNLVLGGSWPFSTDRGAPLFFQILVAGPVGTTASNVVARIAEG